MKMRAPSFAVNSRVPSAFVNRTAVSRRSRIRSAGQIVQQETGSNVYNNVAFYDANQNPVSPAPPTGAGPYYNEYGYQVDSLGIPQLGLAPAPWAMLGAQGQAWTQPGTGYILDVRGNVITPQTAQNLNRGGTPYVQNPPLSPTSINTAATFNPFTFVQQNAPAIAAVTALVVVGILVFSGVGRPTAVPTEIAPARARSPRRSSRRRR